MRTSQSQYQSARAQWYLNLTREALQQGSAVPRGKPTFDLSLAPKQALSNAQTLRVHGAIRSPILIARMNINGKPILVPAASRQIAIDEQIVLQEGANQIRLQARSPSGQTFLWQHAVHTGWRAPDFQLKGNRSAYTLHIRDGNGLASVSLNGQSCDLVDAAGSLEVPLVGRLERQVVHATDSAGNTATFQGAEAAMLLACRTDSRLQYADASMTVPPRSGHAIRLFPEVKTEAVVTADSYLLDFMTKTNRGDEVLVNLNGQELARFASPTGNTVSRFSYLCSLTPGANELVLQNPGRASSRTIQITRQVPCVQRESLRMGAALLAPDVRSLPHLKARRMQMQMLDALLDRPRRLNMVVRDPILCRALTAERVIADRLGAWKLDLRKQAVPKSEWLLYAYTTSWAGQDDWDIVLNAVEVSTGRILFQCDAHSSGFEPDEVRQTMVRLVQKLKQRLPQIQAPLL